MSEWITALVAGLGGALKGLVYFLVLSLVGGAIARSRLSKRLSSGAKFGLIAGVGAALILLAWLASSGYV